MISVKVISNRVPAEKYNHYMPMTEINFKGEILLNAIKVIKLIPGHVNTHHIIALQI